MKNTFSIALLCASLAAVSLLSSCTKELNNPSEGEKESHEVVFELGDNVTPTTPVTKTAITQNGDNISIGWEKTDNSFIHIFENGKEGTKAKITVNKNGKATLSVNFSGLGIDLIKGFTYNGIIAGNYSNGIISVPAVQNPLPGSFDPSADVLIAKAYYEGKLRPILTGLKLDFQRENAISRLELTGMKAGEKIEYIEIAAENPIAGAFRALNNTEFNGYAEGGSNNIKLYFSSNDTIGEDGSFVTYFSSWTTEQEVLTVNVMTENRTYSCTLQSFTLTSDEIKTVKAELEGKDIQTKRYELVTSSPDDWSGTYIFLSSGEEGAAKILNATASGAGYCDDIQINKAGDLIYVNASDEIDNLSWDISDSGSKSNGTTLWNVMTGSAGFLGIGGNAKYLFDNNGITVAKNNYTGSLLKRTYFRHMYAFDNGTQMASFNGKTRTYLEYNGSEFAYTSNEAARVYLFKYKDLGRKSQVLSFKEETVYWTLADGKYEIGQTYPVQAFTKSSSYQKELLSYTSSDPSIASIDADGNITIHKQGDVTIEAVAANNPEYRAAAASYQIVISVPYYQRISSESEIVSGDKYIIVSRTGLIGSLWFHAFNAANPEGGYNYDINNLDNLIISNPIYDYGERIKSTEAIDANQVIIEDGLLSSIAKLLNLSGNYTIKPVSTGSYLYCDMQVEQILDNKIPLPTYSIAFSDSNTEGNILSWISKMSTVPHSITFKEDGSVSVRSALSNNTAIGADLFYNVLTNQYSYVSMSALDGFENLTDFIQYYNQDSEYAWVLNLVKYFGDKISIKELIQYFAADMYIYRYID